ncbi:predicted protein [Scheffersomyces stipitis CBS 6054]|uniref:SCP domain-containing protein n=1 Tax=Scheffersomyces stipitis (strain ATCC 58785 / CBS 6054 / NBRC 10063 / NRRL Y-11545) TaxID=322104 RepID=A3LWR6_PICST|nr:predicted protein [Scheffersomyces stipitis CBS 6054]ABN67684.2 predicted protein [Scheffersomyces stipitis CBS 6054]KAG2732579.1 hypothetical protein G9P44_004996 [Scheffersomyces stipitis]
MRFFTFALFSLLSVVFADIVYVTQTHIVTVLDGVTTIFINGQTPAATTSSVSTKAQARVIVTTVVDGNDATTAPAPAPAPTTSATAAAAPAPAPSPASSAAPANDFGSADKDFAQSILDAHNQKRADHGVSALTWSDDLYQYAQNYANGYSCSGSLVHSGGKYGENLAVGYSSGVTAFDAWYVEGDDYNYNAATQWDHFTQVVWKGTTQLGCAYKDCSAENWGKYVICSYNPPGNVIGQIKENVLPLV